MLEELLVLLFNIQSALESRKRKKAMWNKVSTPLLCALLTTCTAFAEADLLKMIKSARTQIGTTIFYDGTYKKIEYPGGDIDRRRGVCTDVIIRAYRGIGIDLQKQLHEDMSKNFSAYPSKRIWGLNRPDKNIDHRRVPNLQKFFERRGAKIPKNLKKHPPQPGDLITWMLPGHLPHIGIVSDKLNASKSQYLIIHNIGLGTREEDFMGRYLITGHYRYEP